MLLVFIDQEQESEYVSAELFVASNYVLCNCERVAELLLDVIGFLDGLSDLVQPARLESDTNGLVELVVFVASVEHAIDNALHLWINDDTFLLPIKNGNSLLDVLVDTLVDQGLNIFTSVVEIELISGLKCEAEGLFVLCEVVEYFGGNGSG